MPTFKKLILLGRPASGKSELIDFLKKLPLARRQNDFFTGAISELDDFLWLRDKFIEDDIWEAAGHPRLFSLRNEVGYLVTESSILDYCLARFNQEIKNQPADGTVFIEFARGASDGGYRHALNRLSDDVLQDAAILFVYTSYAEALRRNESRYQEKLKLSILAHKVPPKDMERFGKAIDWEELTEGKESGFLTVRQFKIPFVTMNNEPEYKEGPELEARYQKALGQLWKRRCQEYTPGTF